MVQYAKSMHGEMLYFSAASSLIWVGDSKTNFEESHGPFSKIHARRDATSDFSLFVLTWVGDCKTNFLGPFYTAVLMSLIQGWRCRPVARFVDLLTDGMVDCVCV